MKCFIFIYSFNIFIGKYSININILCFLFRYIVRFVDGKPYNCYQKNSNVTDTVTTADSASTSSPDVRQSTNLIETQTQFNIPAAFLEVQTKDTNLNTNIHQLVGKN